METERPDRQERDRFVDGVFAAAGLPLAHVPVSHSYPLPRRQSMPLRAICHLDRLARVDSLPPSIKHLVMASYGDSKLR